MLTKNSSTYSRTSVARTLITRLPRPFRTPSRVPNQENLITADSILFGMGDFLFTIDNGMLRILLDL